MSAAQDPPLVQVAMLREAMLDFLAMISDQMRAGFPGLVDASHWDVVEPCMGTYVVLTNSHSL